MHAKELWMVPLVIVTGHAWIYVSDGQTADKTFIQRLVYLKLRFGIQRIYRFGQSKFLDFN